MSEATPALNRDAEAEVFATGFLKLEGASVDREGNIYVVEKPRGLVHRITPAGEVSPYAEMPVGPNGSTWHRDGRLFCTNPICRSICEIPAGGGAGRVEPGALVCAAGSAGLDRSARGRAAVAGRAEAAPHARASTPSTSR
jgi:hypothetical protein